jgi:hypothetical protein
MEALTINALIVTAFLVPPAFGKWFQCNSPVVIENKKYRPVSEMLEAQKQFNDQQGNKDSAENQY